MSGITAGLLLATTAMTGGQHALLMFPLCLSIAVVYKTTRCDDLRDIPLAAIVLWVTIVLGMYGVGVGLWALFSVMA